MPAQSSTELFTVWPLLVSLWLLPLPAGGQEIGSLLGGAASGDPWAQLNLGAAYDHGLAGITRDPALAVLWYRRAAEAGLAEAQFNLALDPDEARRVREEALREAGSTVNPKDKGYCTMCGPRFCSMRVFAEGQSSEQ